jgi:hypothetical protein
MGREAKAMSAAKWGLGNSNCRIQTCVGPPQIILSNYAETAISPLWFQGQVDISAL